MLLRITMRWDSTEVDKKLRNSLSIAKLFMIFFLIYFKLYNHCKKINTDRKN